MKRSLVQSCGVLILLYLIQGCFVGFTFSVKLLVQRHNATETQQGTLSWANYPFSFKVRHFFTISTLSRFNYQVHMGGCD